MCAASCSTGCGVATYAAHEWDGIRGIHLTRLICLEREPPSVAHQVVDQPTFPPSPRMRPLCQPSSALTYGGGFDGARRLRDTLCQERGGRRAIENMW